MRLELLKIAEETACDARNLVMTVRERAADMPNASLMTLDTRALALQALHARLRQYVPPVPPRLARVKEGVDPKRWLEEWKNASHEERVEFLDHLRALLKDSGHWPLAEVTR